MWETRVRSFAQKKAKHGETRRQINERRPKTTKDGKRHSPCQSPCVASPVRKPNREAQGSADQSMKKPILVSLILLNEPLTFIMPTFQFWNTSTIWLNETSVHEFHRYVTLDSK